MHPNAERFLSDRELARWISTTSDGPLLWKLKNEQRRRENLRWDYYAPVRPEFGTSEDEFSFGQWDAA